MNSIRTTLLCVTSLLVAAAPFAAQVREKIPPPEFVRETVEDEAGRRQWKDFEVQCEPCHGRGKATCQGCNGVELPGCTECKGSKEARCRTCLGTKTLLDPMVEMGCPFCRASGWYNCAQCNGFGSFKVNDQYGGQTPQPCGACKKKGRYECVVCDGKGRIPTVRLKKKPPGEAKLDQLLGLREVLAGCLKAIEEFEPKAKASKSEDALEKLVKKPAKKLPQLKDMLAMLEVALKGLTKAGSSYEGYEARKTHQFLLMKDRTTYMLQHNVRVLDQCIARAEHNAGIEKGK